MLNSSLIQRAYQFTAESDVHDDARYTEEVDKLLAYIKSNNGKDLLIPLNLYINILNDSDLALLQFMDKQKKQALLRNTQVTYLFLLAQKKHENEHQKSENDTDYNEHLKKCRALIDAINYKKHCEQQNIQPAPEAGYQSEEQPASYLGLYAGYFFAHQMQRSTAGSFTKNIIEPLSSFNQKRLYWIWGSGFVKTLLGLLPADFFFKNQANKTIRTPDPYTGCMSWGIYYFRFAINVYLVMKHTIPSPLMSKEEQSTPWNERFLTQIQQRKFVLLNDFFWGTANALCFFLLYGKGALGTAGDIMTIALLAMDISLAVWNFEEDRTQYNQEKEDYEEALHCLKLQKEELIDVQKKKGYKRLIKQKIQEIELQMTTMTRAHKQNEQAWSFKKNQLTNNILYAVGLLMAFVLLTAPFFPLPAATLAAMTLSGAILCFAFAVIYNGVKGGLELHQTRLNAKVDQEEFIKKFDEFIKERATASDDDNKLRFLEIKKLALKNKNHEKTLSLQTLKLIQSVLIESLVPPLIFLSLVFFPLGTALAVLGTAIGVSMSTQAVMGALFKKESEELTPFDKTEYDEFIKTYANTEMIDSKSTLGFFTPKNTVRLDPESNNVQSVTPPRLDSTSPNG